MPEILTKHPKQLRSVNDLIEFNEQKGLMYTVKNEVLHWINYTDKKTAEKTSGNVRRNSKNKSF